MTGDDKFSEKKHDIGSTSPGDGKEVLSHETSGTDQIPFKERVIGVAQVSLELDTGVVPMINPNRYWH